MKLFHCDYPLSVTRLNMPDDINTAGESRPDPRPLEYRAISDEPRRMPPVLQFFMGALLSLMVCIGSIVILIVLGGELGRPVPQALLGRAIVLVMLAALTLFTVWIHRRRRWKAFTAGVVIVFGLLALPLGSCFGTVNGRNWFSW
jgi:hypothetical protein